MKTIIRKTLLLLTPFLLVAITAGISCGQLVYEQIYIGNGTYIKLNEGNGKEPIYLVVDNPNDDAIIKQQDDKKGWVISEHDSNFVKWNRYTAGDFNTITVPFGLDTSLYIPLILTPFDSLGLQNYQSDISFATWETDTTMATGRHNRDTKGNYPPEVHSIDLSYMIKNVVDRWWRISFDGEKGKRKRIKIQDITFYYVKGENSIDAPRTDLVKAQQWLVPGQKWSGLYMPGYNYDYTPHYDSVGACTAEKLNNLDTLSSLWVLVRSTTPLPVEFLYFNAQCDNHHIILNWGTASETNSAYFAVQRSMTGNDFSTIGTVAAAGNSNYLRTYSFIDYNPPGQMVYYRLKQVDNNGEFKFSSVVQGDVNCNNDKQPVDAYTYFDRNNQTVAVVINGYEGKATVIIRDMMGRQLTQKTTDAYGIVNLDVGYLTTGVYLIIIETDVKIFTKKIYIGR